MQELPEGDLLGLQAANDADIDRHFNWDRFTDQVVAAIESTDSPPCLPLDRATAARLRWLSVRRQASVLGPSQLRSSIRVLVGSTSAGHRLLAARRARRGTS